jgi:RWD domain
MATSPEMQLLAREEAEALEAIFDTSNTVKTDNGRGISTCSILLDNGALSLEVGLTSGYPMVPPTRVLVCGQWVNPIGVDFHMALAQFVRDLPLGEPMIFAIHAHAQDLLVQFENERPQQSLLPFLVPKEKLSQPAPALKQQVQSRPPSTSRSAVTALPRQEQQPVALPRQRPREMARNFWSLHPRDTPPAEAFPKIGFLLDQARKSLPAAKARNEFLAAMKKAKEQGSRVVLVTGETGSGPCRSNLYSLFWCVSLKPLFFILANRENDTASCIPFGR